MDRGSVECPPAPLVRRRAFACWNVAAPDGERTRCCAARTGTCMSGGPARERCVIAPGLARTSLRTSQARQSQMDQQQQTKTRGVADIVFLIDVSGSMEPAIDALK